MTQAQINILVTLNDQMSQKLDNLKAKTSEFASTAKDRLGGAMNTVKNLALGAGTALIGLGVAIGTQVVKATISAENRLIMLETALEGNKQAAINADKFLNNFGKKTPYQVEELTDTFVKLSNLGIKPTENLLTSLGNTASAMGKPLTQLTEAVLDAASGEFERLKEFGIKSKSMGDKVEFTFRGIKTTVKNSSESIVQYLQKIGNTQFAGAMDKQSQTIAGKWSTLLDTINTKYVDFSKSISGSQGIGSVLDFITQKIESFDLTNFNNQIETFIQKFKTTFEQVRNIYIDITTYLTTNDIGLMFISMFDKMKSIDFKTIADTIKNFLGSAIIWLGDSLKIFKPIIEVVGNVIKDIEPHLKELSKSFNELYTIIQPYLLPVLDFLGKILIGVVLVGIMFVVKAFDLLIQGLNFGINKMRDFANFLVDVFNYISRIVKNPAQAIVDNFTWAGDTIKWVIRSAANFAVDKLNNVISGINMVIRMSRNITGMSWIPEVPTIPRYATGTISASGLATINENGKKEGLRLGDTVYLPQNSQVYTSSDTKQMSMRNDRKTDKQQRSSVDDSNVNVTMNVTINNPISSKKEVTEWARAMKTELKNVLAN